MKRLRSIDAVKEELRNATDMVALIGRYVELHQQGKNFFGKCPFHEDDSPSFNVTPSKNVWSCLGCRQAGDVYRFIEKFHQCSFLDAIEIISELTGFNLAPFYRELTPEEALLSKCYEATSKIADALCDELTLHPEIMDWFYERGIGPLSLERFKVGYCPSVAWIEEKVEAGLLQMIEPSAANREAVFGGHILYPQFTPSGEVWGWYARTDGKPKYRGPSRESFLFSGTARLYGLHLARRMPGVRESGLVLVEGFNDAIAAQQYGFPAVATCGTELTADHIQTLQAHSISKAIVVFDGDDGGRSGMMRLALRAHEVHNIDLKFGTIPGDPDEFLTQRGGEAFAQVLKDAVYSIEYVLTRNEDGDLSSTTAQLDFLNRVRPFVLAYPRNSIYRGIASRLLADRLNLNVDAISDFLDEGMRDDPLVSISGEQIVLAGLLADAGNFIRMPELRADDFALGRHKVLFSLLRELYHDGVPVNEDIVLTEARNRQMGQHVFDLIERLHSVTVSNIEYHYSDIREKSLRRRAIDISTNFGSVIRDMQQPAAQSLAQLSESVTGLVVRPTRNVVVSGAVATDLAVTQMQERMASPSAIRGLSLGRDWSYLNGWISGLGPGRVHLLAALTGVGKSVIGLANWVHCLSIKDNGPKAAGIIFAMEMSASENLSRLAAIESGVPQAHIRDGRFVSNETAKMVIEAYAKIKKAKLTWVERTLSMPDIAFQCRMLKTKGLLDYVVIDYMQLLDLSPYNDRWSRTEKYCQASSDLHDLAEDLNVPIVAIAQLNRNAYEDEISTARDIGECFRIYQDCHVCYTLTRHGENRLVGFLDKNRDGVSNMACELYYDNAPGTATLRAREQNVRNMTI